MIGRPWIFLLFGLASVLLPCINAVAVMSVDLGSEWMKVAVVSPGVPMEIALNKESKRKTPVAIAFRDGERLFGDDALGVGVRFPRLSYAYLLELLGKRLDHPAVRLFRKRFPYYDLIEDPQRGTVIFTHDSETQFTPEQLLAQILTKAREYASESARQIVNEAVLTVPGYFNQAERRAVLQAAELAGIKVLQLINDYTAVALNYGIFRRKDFNESAQYIMFYDMGASSTSATVVSYQLVKTKDKGFVETNPQLSILGVGYNRNLGGLEVQLRLRDFLGRKFNEKKKTPNDVFESPRALAKLFKEAGRLKNVLSANVEHYAQVENLLDDEDFKLLVTREDLENQCNDIFDQVTLPVEQALKTSGLSMDLISQVILVGAGTRVPKVQEVLSRFVDRDLGKNLNTDEAAAMGAVYKAADLSSGFKVKKFITKDAVLFPIQVVFEREVEGQPTPKQVKRILFGPMNPYPQKKVLTFNKHTEDFEFNVNYAELDHLPADEVTALGDLHLSRVALTGVGAALNKHTGAPGTESKGIKAHFVLDESGILSLAGVELVLEKTLSEEELRKQEAEAAAAAAEDESPLSKLGSTISKLFTATEETKPAAESSSKEDEKESQEEQEAGEEKKEGEGEEKSEEEGGGGVEEEKKQKTKKKKDESKDGKKEEATKNATASETKKSGDKKPKVVVIKEAIAAAETNLGVPKLNEDQLQEAAKRLDALNEFDRQRVRRASALNALEAFVFDAQTKLETEEYQQASTDAETEKIRTSCSEVADWLYEDGLEADAETYEQKLSQLRSLTLPLYKRVREHQERPMMLDTLHQALNRSEHFLAAIRNRTAAAEAAEDGTALFTAVELNTLEKTIKETQEWKSKMEETQATIPLYETPKLTIKSIEEKMALLEREVKYLSNKAKIWRPPKPKTDKEKEAKNETKSDTLGEDSEEPLADDAVLPEDADSEEHTPPTAAAGDGAKAEEKRTEGAKSEEAVEETLQRKSEKVAKGADAETATRNAEAKKKDDAHVEL